MNVRDQGAVQKAVELAVEIMRKDGATLAFAICKAAEQYGVPTSAIDQWLASALEYLTGKPKGTLKIRRESSPVTSVPVIMPGRPPWHLPSGWKLVAGGLYAVSPEGQVCRAAGGGRRYKAGHVLKQRAERDQLWVLLHLGDGKTTTHVQVASLMAGAFLGPCPPGHGVSFKDGNPMNVRLDNLKYVPEQQPFTPRLVDHDTRPFHRNGMFKDPNIKLR